MSILVSSIPSSADAYVRCADFDAAIASLNADLKSGLSKKVDTGTFDTALADVRKELSDLSERVAQLATEDEDLFCVAAATPSNFAVLVRVRCQGHCL